MKSALSLTLAACLLAPAVRLSAQGPRTTIGSHDVRDAASQGVADALAGAAVRAAAGLAAEAAQAKPARSNWSRVRHIRPGTAIRLTVKGPQSGQRYFIAADDSSLTVGDRKIAGREQIVAKIARDDVAEITAMRRAGVAAAFGATHKRLDVIYLAP